MYIPIFVHGVIARVCTHGWWYKKAHPRANARIFLNLFFQRKSERTCSFDCNEPRLFVCTRPLHSIETYRYSVAVQIGHRLRRPKRPVICYNIVIPRFGRHNTDTVCRRYSALVGKSLVIVCTTMWLISISTRKHRSRLNRLFWKIPVNKIRKTLYFPDIYAWRV